MAVQDWSTAFEVTPAGSDQVSQGDDRIRELKETLTAELQPEHDVGDATFGAAAGNYEDTGRHVPGSARSFLQSAAPTGLWEPTDAGAMPPVDLNPDKQASSALDNGRIWVDLDDAQPYVREQVITGAAWSGPNTGEGVPGAAWVSLWPRTTAYEGTATDDNQLAGAADTREIITGCSVDVPVPDDARVYEIVVSANVRYQLDNEGQMGFWLVRDIPAVPAPTDVDIAIVQAEGIGGGGLFGAASLSHVFTAPVAGTTYRFSVEFATAIGAGGNVVNPDVTNGFWAAIGAAAGDFVGVETFSRVTAELRPRYLVASYFG